MALTIEFPNGPSFADSAAHMPRSGALWLALMALHHLRFDYPPLEYFTDKNIDDAITITWVEYMEVALEEMSN